MRALRTLRQGALTLVFFFLAACGGSKNDASTTTTAIGAPTAIATYASSVPATAVVTLDGSASTAVGGGPLTYAWALTSVPTGSTATIANTTAAQAQLTTDVVGTYTVTLTVNDGQKSQVASFSLATNAYTPPTIVSSLVEPVSGVVQLSLSADQGTSTVAWTVDGTSIGSGATVNWDTTRVADGSHVVVAQIQSIAKYSIGISRTFQVMQTPVNFTSATISESAGVFTAIVGPQSVNGIVRVDATLDGVAIGSLAAPNTCLDPTGAACVATGANGYVFTGTVASGLHVVVVTATDGIGRNLGSQLSLNVTDVP